MKNRPVFVKPVPEKPFSSYMKEMNWACQVSKLIHKFTRACSSRKAFDTRKIILYLNFNVADIVYWDIITIDPHIRVLITRYF